MFEETSYSKFFLKIPAYISLNFSQFQQELKNIPIQHPSLCMYAYTAADKKKFQLFQQISKNNYKEFHTFTYFPWPFFCRNKGQLEVRNTQTPRFALFLLTNWRKQQYILGFRNHNLTFKQHKLSVNCIDFIVMLSTAVVSV
jgi:hypothetical protein